MWAKYTVRVLKPTRYVQRSGRSPPTPVQCLSTFDHTAGLLLLLLLLRLDTCSARRNFLLDGSSGGSNRLAIAVHQAHQAFADSSGYHEPDETRDLGESIADQVTNDEVPVDGPLSVMSVSSIFTPESNS